MTTDPQAPAPDPDKPPVTISRELWRAVCGASDALNGAGDLAAVAEFATLMRDAPKHILRVVPASGPEERETELREELAAVLRDWNALVKASGSPTNGGAVAHVTRMVADLAALRASRPAVPASGGIASAFTNSSTWGNLGSVAQVVLSAHGVQAHEWDNRRADEQRDFLLGLIGNMTVPSAVPASGERERLLRAVLVPIVSDAYRRGRSEKEWDARPFVDAVLRAVDEFSAKPATASGERRELSDETIEREWDLSEYIVHRFARAIWARALASPAAAPRERMCQCGHYEPEHDGPLDDGECLGNDLACPCQKFVPAHPPAPAGTRCQHHDGPCECGPEGFGLRDDDPRVNAAPAGTPPTWECANCEESNPDTVMYCKRCGVLGMRKLSPAGTPREPCNWQTFGPGGPLASAVEVCVSCGSIDKAKCRSAVPDAGEVSEKAKCCDACYRGSLDTASAREAGHCYDPKCHCHSPRSVVVSEREAMLARRVGEFLDYVGRVKSLHRGVVLNYCSDMRSALAASRQANESGGEARA